MKPGAGNREAGIGAVRGCGADVRAFSPSFPLHGNRRREDSRAPYAAFSIPGSRFPVPASAGGTQ